MRHLLALLLASSALASPSAPVSPAPRLKLRQSYNVGTTAADSVLTLDATRGGLRLNIAGAALPDSTGGLDNPEGVHYPDGLALGVYDSTLLDAASALAPKRWWGINKRGEQLCAANNHESHTCWFPSGIDTHLQPADSSGREGGDFYIQAGGVAADNAGPSYFGGSVHILGGSRMTGSVASGGGINVDSDENASGAPGGNYVRRCAADTQGDFRLGVCGAQGLVMGPPLLDKASGYTQINAGGSSMYLRSANDIQFSIINTALGGSLSFLVFSANSDSAGSPRLRGNQALYLDAGLDAAGTRLRWELNTASNYARLRDMVGVADIFKIDAAASPKTLTMTGTIAATSGGSASKVVCWRADAKTLGYCSSAVDGSGGCTCN